MPDDPARASRQPRHPAPRSRQFAGAAGATRWPKPARASQAVRGYRFESDSCAGASLGRTPGHALLRGEACSRSLALGGLSNSQASPLASDTGGKRFGGGPFLRRRRVAPGPGWRTSSRASRHSQRHQRSAQARCKFGLFNRAHPCDSMIKRRPMPTSGWVCTGECGRNEGVSPQFLHK